MFQTYLQNVLTLHTCVRGARYYKNKVLLKQRLLACLPPCPHETVGIIRKYLKQIACLIQMSQGADPKYFNDTQEL